MVENNTEIINQFLEGQDPLEHIVSIECGYDDNEVFIILYNDKGQKVVRKDDFKPFVWAKQSVCERMFEGDRKQLQAKMKEFGIGVKALQTSIDGKEENERLTNGYKYIFQAKRKMSYQKFMMFFQLAKTPIYPKKKKNEPKSDSTQKEFLAVSPVEQYMMYTSRRMFKGSENYDDQKRLLFDLETEGLNPEIHAIDQIGIRTNKGFEKIITIEGNDSIEKKQNELKAIIEFLSIIRDEKPDVVAGHNSEKFDWFFIEERCKALQTSLEELSKDVIGFRHPIFKKKKETVLKLGGEVEYYCPTIMWGHNIADSLHAVRRAQAIDSNMKSANLKYVTKYLDLKKENRVYVPGQQIGTIWRDLEPSYALNDSNGDWYKISDKKPLQEGYDAVSGKYIVERYLLDDIWETDKVELALNESNFLIGKLLPTTFQRACTMGTAGIWKLIMLAWCYENNLAIPSFAPSKSFTGGLSRLLKVGFVNNVVKLDFNSLYPSIDLTWNVSTTLDISDCMLSMLNYILTAREKYKELKAIAGTKAKEIDKKIKELEKNPNADTSLIQTLKQEKQKWEMEKSANDKKQLPLKILANSFFGSYGSPNIFPFGDTKCAEKTTCIGRQSLRLMIYHFTNIGYTPIVGDTDGFNFQMPKSFRYTNENPYIGKGLGRNVEKGKAYTLVDADVAEFEDLYLNQAWNGGVNKMGLGIDEYCDATINFARKNYADLLDSGKTKKVGNTIKSRRMSGYIEKFLETGIDLLLNGKGQEFLESYYNYIYKIYNYQIPLRDIASKGKIKKTIADYKADCNTLTKSGSKKSRQAWYELVIKENMKVNLDDTIYYINCGTKKSESDVKRITHQFVKVNNEIVELTTKIKKDILLKACENKGIEYKTLKEKDKKELLKPFIVKEEDEIILNCKIVPTEIVEADEDIMCNDDIEYNVVKYIEQFNNRITPLLVCFSKDIRDNILIKNPDERPYFTTEQCQLVSGEPTKPTDQDTYEQLMKPERKEIEFWLSINETPPFIKECNINWDNLVNEYKEIKAQEDNALFKDLDEQYINIISKLQKEDINKLEEEGIVPKELENIVTLNPNDLCFYFNDMPHMTPSTGGYLFDDIKFNDTSENEYEAFIASESYE